MTTVPITPLDDWIRRKIGMDGDRSLTRTALAEYQLQALNRTIDLARSNSSFYRTHLAGLPDSSLPDLDRLRELPFTTTDDILRDPLALVCVSQSDIARVITMESSGTTGRPKRIFFTDADLELTIDFFHHGMSTLVEPGQRVLILLPGALPDSVGDLLTRALDRMAVTGIVHGPVHDPAAAVHAAITNNVDSLVGIPVQVLAMACVDEGDRLSGLIRTVLLSTDYVPDAIVRRIQAAWKCRVFKHYGMTEMGLGGGVECAALSGYHVRESDLLVEIVDPQTGSPVPGGSIGELVFTTLTRRGMPLIRYRTGDLAALDTGACICGTTLASLAVVMGRETGAVDLGGHRLHLAEIDDVLFNVESILDFSVRIDTSHAVDRLDLTISRRPEVSLEAVTASVEKALSKIPAISNAKAAKRLKLRVKPAKSATAASSGSTKRQMHDHRKRTQKP